MNNQIYHVHGMPTILHRSSRKLVWLSLPDLQPIYKYYTRSKFYQITESGSVLVMDGTNVSLLTIELPPATLCEYQR